MSNLQSVTGSSSSHLWTHAVLDRVDPQLQTVRSVKIPDPTLGTPELTQPIGSPGDGQNIQVIQAQTAETAEPPKLQVLSREARAVEVRRDARASLAPPREWTDKIARYAEGGTSGGRPGRNETRMRELGQAIQSAGSGSDPATRSDTLARTLSSKLGQKPLADGALIPRPAMTSPRDLLTWVRTSLSPRAAELRQATMVAHALEASLRGPANAAAREEALRAIMQLSPGERDTLLQGDRLGGGKLTTTLHAMTGSKDAQTAALYRSLRADVGIADLGLRLDRQDPSGETSGLVHAFRGRLEEMDVPPQTRLAFDEHLAFQSQIGDFNPSPVLGNHSRAALTTDLMTRFAALEEMPKSGRAERTKPGDDPAATPPGLKDHLGRLDGGDLKLLLAKSVGTPTEGGQHILRAARDLLLRTPNALGSEAPLFLELMAKAERGAASPALLWEGVVNGAPLDTIQSAMQLDFRAGADLALSKIEAGVKNTLAEIGKRLEKLPKDDAEGATDATKVERAALENFRDQYGEMTIDRAGVDALVERFGIRTCTEITWQSYTSEDPRSNLRALSTSMNIMKQVETQLAALTDPQVLRDGLADLVPLLPTAGKSLENFHFVESAVADLVAVADAIRKTEGDDAFTLAGTPLIVIDQSDGDGLDAGKVQLWKNNESYLQGLRDRYGDSHGLRIVHVSMQAINAMTAGSGIEKMFDTTRQGNPGYGGARNIAFMLGPVIADAVKNGHKLDTIKPDELVGLVKSTALGTDGPNLFMGDDTDYIRPGGLFAKVGINVAYEGEYFTATSLRDGRATTGVASLNVKIVDATLDETKLMGDAFKNSKVDPNPKRPGMGCVTGGARFCFDIPTGAEEKHHVAATSYNDQFARVSHLSGDRMKPLDRQIADYMTYAAGTEMFKALSEQDSAIRWNKAATDAASGRRDKFASNREVLAMASDATGARQDQEGFLGRLGGWLAGAERDSVGPFGVKQANIDSVDRFLAGNPSLDVERRAELGRVKDGYRTMMAQADAIKRFGDTFLKTVVPGFDTLKEADRMPAIQAALTKDPGIGRIAFDAAMKAEVTDKNVSLKARDQQMLRDFTLIVESLGANGFRDLAAKLAA